MMDLSSLPSSGWALSSPFSLGLPRDGVSLPAAPAEPFAPPGPALVLPPHPAAFPASSSRCCVLAWFLLFRSVLLASHLPGSYHTVVRKVYLYRRSLCAFTVSFLSLTQVMFAVLCPLVPYFQGVGFIDTFILVWLLSLCIWVAGFLHPVPAFIIKPRPGTSKSHSKSPWSHRTGRSSVAPVGWGTWRGRSLPGGAVFQFGLGFWGFCQRLRARVWFF